MPWPECSIWSLNSPQYFSNTEAADQCNPPQVPCKALWRPQLGQDTGRGSERLLLLSMVEPVCTIYFHCWVGGIFPMRDGWCSLNLLVTSRRADISREGNFNIWKLLVFRVLWLLIGAFHCRLIHHATTRLRTWFLSGIHLMLTRHTPNANYSGKQRYRISHQLLPHFFRV